ncbi:MULTISPECIES: DUF1345 domain-containing protein [Micromonospora]|uniref:DUF1345 domain-containing protein n=1 Tax=Micromonospora TaxID=1873 RepID=UPI00081FCD46|nr:MULTISPECIES: DUF1345 domain-containing protein [Micromonospora]MBQ0979935.1 DUF1345 domain-containing protein [Micromonospora sp. M61]TQJ22319.1 putative membrane protein [Micromonospora sp. A202]SCG48974.1 Uncharacterized membrane protein [Micromonospora zamorensis]
MTQTGPDRPADVRFPAAAKQLAVVAVVGVIAGGVFTLMLPVPLAALAGWDVGALSWLVLVWHKIWPMDAERTAELAVHEDPNRAIRDALLLVACLASLLAVGLVVASAQSAPPGMARELHSGLGVLSVVLSWFVVHTVFAARYARIYYTGPDGGVNFNQHDPPRYSDFAYVAFTIGATFQVSDTNLTSNEMRRTVLRHSMVSYLFGAFIIAVTVNLLAGLAR